jgi:hypothetical protein
MDMEHLPPGQTCIFASEKVARIDDMILVTALHCQAKKATYVTQAIGKISNAPGPAIS